MDLHGVLRAAKYSNNAIIHVTTSKIHTTHELKIKRVREVNQAIGRVHHGVHHAALQQRNHNFLWCSLVEGLRHRDSDMDASHTLSNTTCSTHDMRHNRTLDGSLLKSRPPATRRFILEARLLHALQARQHQRPIAELGLSCAHATCK